MAAIKSYTSLEQSKKLAEILPLESADLYYEWPNKKVHFKDDKYSGMGFSCWSLAALLDILPEGTRLLKSTNISSVGDTKYHCDCPKSNIDSWFDNPVDACYVMIIRLHELNLL